VASSSTTCDLRHDRWRTTHNGIRDAALELVAAHGFDAVSIEMITAKADVGYRTFFNHFSCKEAALIEAGDERALAVLEAFETRPATESTLQALRAATLQQAAFFAEHDRTIKLRFAVLEANPCLIPRFVAEFASAERAIAEAVAHRTGLDVDNDLYPPLLAAVAVGVLRTCIVRWRKAGWEGSLAAMVEEAFDLVATGMQIPEPGGQHEL
jgi:AcrR family transcriptional regulator